MNEIELLRPHLDRIQRLALIIGGVGVGLCVIGLFVNRPQFFQSYLLGYLLWISVPLGCFAIVMLHHMVGGGWGFVIRRLLEAGTRTFLPMLVLFVPILFGMHDLYEWTHDAARNDAVLQHKSAYLNLPFFWTRTAIYFVVWIGLAYLLNRWSLQQDKTGDRDLTRKLQDMSGPGLLLYGATATFASVDWAMSLEPHWFSTIYGILFMVGQGLTTLAFMIVALALLVRHRPLSDVVTQSHFHDLGNLMLAFVMLWGYVGISQYLIIWSGNLPEEIPWYLNRTQGGWQWVALLLVVCQFALPFLLLLSRTTKRTIRALATLAGVIIFVRLLDLFWLVMPAFHPKDLHIHWMDLAAPIGIGGLWIAAFVWQLKGHPLLPVHDPRLEQTLHG
jgi:hypothetical protein